MCRRLFRAARGALVAVLSLALVVLPRVADQARAAATYPAVLLPASGAYLGSHVQPRAGETKQTAIERVEASIGRRFAVDRQYYVWNDAFPTAYDTWTFGHGRIPFISWKPVTSSGTVVPWATIASGAVDAQIVARADAVRAWGRPMYLSFHHEPENDVGAFGTAAEFVAAYRHVVDVFRAQGVTNVAWVWTMMGSSFQAGTAGPFYPGDAYVDFVAVDAYNWYPGRTSSQWRSFANVVSPARTFSVQHGKPLIVAEYGCQEDPDVPGRKAQWFADELAALKSWPEVKAVLYYDSNRVYPWITDSSTSALQAYATIADDPFLNPSAPTPSSSPSPSPSPSPAPSAAPSPSSSPSLSPSASSTPGATASPAPSPPSSVSPSPSASPSSSPTASPTPSPKRGNGHQQKPTSGECTIVGTRRPDRLVGTTHADVICGRGGSDVILGRGGDDLIVGGRGGDRLKGESGDDTIWGGSGSDVCRQGGGRGRTIGCGTLRLTRLAVRLGAFAIVGATAWRRS